MTHVANPGGNKCRPTIAQGGVVDPAKNCFALASNYSYSYWGHVIQGEWFMAESDVTAIANAFSLNNAPLRLMSGWNANVDFTLSDGSVVTTRPVREGIERFFITDINNPAASAEAQSTIPVMWDTILTDFSGFGSVDTNQFNHIPGGTNVLFMDGHCEFGKYPQPDGSNMFMLTRLVQDSPKGQPFP